MRSEATASTPAPRGNRQLPLPLDLPVSPTALLPRTAVTLPPQEVWHHLSAAARRQIRDVFRRILQEVVDDAAQL